MTCTIPCDWRGCGHGASEKVGDVFGTDRVLLHAAREGGAHGVVPIGGEQAMEAIDVAQPDLRPSMGERTVQYPRSNLALSSAALSARTAASRASALV